MEETFTWKPAGHFQAFVTIWIGLSFIRIGSVADALDSSKPESFRPGAESNQADYKRDPAFHLFQIVR
jgi:hypothetical protein